MSFRNAEIHRDVKPRDYHPWKGNAGIARGNPNFCLSRSELLLMLDCGEMFIAGGRRLSSSSLSFGSLLDLMLLTPGEFSESYITTPATYESGGEEKKWSKQAKVCKEWNKENPDKEPPATYTTPTVEKPWTKQSKTCMEWENSKRKEGFEIITLKQRDEAAEAARRIRSDSTLGALIEACETQVCITADWISEGLTIPVRILIDAARGLESTFPIVYDLKSAQEIDPYHMERSAKNYHYDVQAWMYSEIVRVLCGSQLAPFGFICVRNTEPYLKATYRASEALLMQGRAKFLKAMNRYIECVKSGKWNGYTQGFELL